MKKLLPKAIFIFVVIGLLIGVFSLGINVGQTLPKNIKVQNITNTEPPSEKSIDFNTFWQTWNIIDGQFLNSDKISNQTRVYGAIKGLVDSLGDPHSEFFNPKDSKNFEENIQGNFGGIGAEIGLNKNNQLIIIAPLKNTPAEQAGLKPQDIILGINATSTENLDVEEAISHIRGEINTTVTLTILRENWEKPKDFKIIRKIITVPTLDLEIKDGSIAYVSLHSFNANANLLFYETMVKALSSGSKGMVLDLRNNPGGYLQVAVDITSWFLPRGTVIVKEVDRNKKEDKFLASGNAALKDFPVVVLVNGGSASASEILAGALRDQRQIKLVGEKTFGKGTVQQVESLTDGSSIKITIANWVMPKGEIIEGKGLIPDYEIELTETDILNQKDPQLEKALEILKLEINKNKNTLFRLSQ